MKGTCFPKDQVYNNHRGHFQCDKEREIQKLGARRWCVFEPMPSDMTAQSEEHPDGRECNYEPLFEGCVAGV